MKNTGYVLAKFAKPCPFCGSKHLAALSRERFDELNSDRIGYSTIECDDCGARITNATLDATDYSDSYRAVLKLWNRRCA